MADSSSSDSDEVEWQQKEPSLPKTILPNPLANPLPSPDIDGPELAIAGRVFANKFEQAEQAKQHVLEKHVKMTGSEHLKGRNVKICWKFRKGRCPFGKNCKYSHDMDTNLSLRYTESNTDEAVDPALETNTCTNNRPYHHGNHQRRPLPDNAPRIGFMGTVATLQSNKRSQPRLQGREPPPDPEDDDNYMASAKRKKSSGVSETLLPPKRAMSALQQQRKEERPWTMKK